MEETIERHIARISETRLRTDYKDLKELSRHLKDATIDALHAIRPDNSWSIWSEAEALVEDLRWRSAMEVIHLFERAKSRLLKSDLPVFLLDLQNDLQVEQPLVIVEGNHFEVHSFLDYTSVSEKLQKYLPPDCAEHYERAEALNLAVVEVPMFELDNPLAWSALVHEVAHRSQVSSAELPESLRPAVPHAKRPDLAIDMWCMYHVGPIYAVALIQFFRELRLRNDAKDVEHPAYATRFAYLESILRHQMGAIPEGSLPHALVSRALTWLAEQDSPDPVVDDDVEVGITEAMEENQDDIMKWATNLLSRQQLKPWWERLVDDLQKTSFRRVISNKPADVIDELTRMAINKVVPPMWPGTTLNLSLLLDLNNIKHMRGFHSAMLACLRKNRVLSIGAAVRCTTPTPNAS